MNREKFIRLTVSSLIALQLHWIPYLPIYTHYRLSFPNKQELEDKTTQPNNRASLAEARVTNPLLFQDLKLDQDSVQLPSQYSPDQYFVEDYEQDEEATTIPDSPVQLDHRNESRSDQG